MVVDVSKHDPASLPPVLHPRSVVPEKTREQRREERRKSICDAIHGNLHALYDQVMAEEYTGPINSHRAANGLIDEPKREGVGTLGLELSQPFTAHLEWYVFSHAEMSRESRLGRAFLELAHEHPAVYEVLRLHLAEDLSRKEIAERRHIDRNKAGEMFRYGLGLLAGKLGAWRRPTSN